MDTMDTLLSIENYKFMRGPSEMYVYTYTPTYTPAGGVQGGLRPPSRTTPPVG